MPGAPLWTPSPERITEARITDFRRFAADRADRPIDAFDDLHRWSVERPEQFWRAVWDHSGVIGDPGERVVEMGSTMADTRFFPDARLSVIENLLDGRGRPGSDPALIATGDDGSTRILSWDELRFEVAAVAAALRSEGIEPGDRVVAWMPHVPETVILMLGAVALGATFSSTSADFGASVVLDRFGQIEPVVLLAAEGYTYGGRRFDRVASLREIRDALPSVRRVVVAGDLDPSVDLGTIRGSITWEDFIAPHRGATLSFERFPFDQPLYILYSSGTTGPPKCIVHRTGGILLKHLQEQQHHCDIRVGDRVFYFTTAGWMMWNWLVSALGSGATIVLYDGNPFHPGPTALFDVAERFDVTLLGVSAKYLDAARASGLRPRLTHRLDALRTVCSTGSALSPEGFAFVYEAIGADLHLASISGGTDLCGCFVGGDPTRPVWTGEIQAPGLGMAVDVFDELGRPLPSGTGELVCTRPFPSMPLGLWGDADGTRYRAAYYERFPDIWTHGDFAEWTEHGGMIIHGRSDATLNAGGVRIGTAEIYRQVEQVEGVEEAIAVAQEWEHDTRIVLFVRLTDGIDLTPELEERICLRLRERASPRHVPARIAAVADIPRTRSGKITELAVTAVVNGHPVKNTEALANPEALAQFANRPELRS
jgi:acetoacetyl-CoA synthetase